MNLLKEITVVLVIAIIVVLANGNTISRVSRAVKSKTEKKAPAKFADLASEERILMTGGPSNPFPRAIKALSMPLMNIMEKHTFRVLDEVRQGLQYIFQTENEWTLAVSGSGHLGIETILANLIEPGETVLVLVNGMWGFRVSEMAKGMGAIVKNIEKPLGVSFTMEEIEEGLKTFTPTYLYIIHGESSTGVIQQVEGAGDLCKKHNCMLLLDVVGTIASVPVYIDKWKVDAALCNTQKGIGSVAGFAPVTFSQRSVDKILARKVPMKSFYTDMRNLTTYWGIPNGRNEPRRYHHTIPVLSLYALHEALATLIDETLEEAWSRHSDATAKLYTGLEALGMEHYVAEPKDRLITTITYQIPKGVRNVVDILLYTTKECGIEIGAGLGPTLFKVVRIGVMGANAYEEKIDKVVKCLKEAIDHAKNLNQTLALS